MSQFRLHALLVIFLFLLRSYLQLGNLTIIYSLALFTETYDTNRIKVGCTCVHSLLDLSLSTVLMSKLSICIYLPLMRNDKLLIFTSHPHMHELIIICSKQNKVGTIIM